MSEFADEGKAPIDSTRRWGRISLWVSLTFHVVLLSALGVWFVGRRNAERISSARIAADRTDTKSRKNSQLSSPKVSSKQLRATLERATEKYANVSTTEQLNQLEKHAAKLESLSTPKSVADIAENFQEWIPTPQRASEPGVDPSAGEFDFDTAQIHDIVRAANADGSWEYRSILVDASGRTFEVEIDQAEGEKVHATFASLKKFPLADQVYRQIAMSLMDRALQAERSARMSADSHSPTVVEPEGAAFGGVDDRDPFDNSGSPR